MKLVSDALVKSQKQFKPVSVEGFEHYKISPTGNILNSNNKKIKEKTHRLGYKAVILYSKSRSKRKNFYVHRLVALTFLPNPQKLPEVNHKDGIKSNNDVYNLEWVTRKENVRHAFKNGLIKHKKGDNHHSTKLTELDKEYIKAKLALAELSQLELSKMFNVSIATISMVGR